MEEDIELIKREPIPTKKTIGDVVGFSLRVASSAQFTFEDVFSLWSNLALFLDDRTALIVLVSLVGAGGFYTNYGFWGGAIQKNTKTFIDKLMNCCSPEFPSEPELAEPLFGSEVPRSAFEECCRRFNFFTMTPLNGILIFSNNAFFMREALKKVSNTPEDTTAILGAAITSSAISTVFGLFTESLSIWRELNEDDNDNDNTEEEETDYLFLRYLLSVVGTLNSSAKSGLAIYLQVGSFYKNVALQSSFCAFFTITSFLKTFYFRAGVLLKNTPLMNAIEKNVIKINKTAKIAILIPMGVTQVADSFSQSRFTNKQIYTEIFGKELGVVMSTELINTLAVSQASLVTIGEFASEFAEVIVQFNKVEKKSTRTPIELEGIEIQGDYYRPGYM